MLSWSRMAPVTTQMYGAEEIFLNGPGVEPPKNDSELKNKFLTFTEKKILAEIYKSMVAHFLYLDEKISQPLLYLFIPIILY